MPILTLLAIILIEGFVTISVEILTLRQLTPFVGNSVIVTSLIIGIFLLFLAIGYWRGGQHCENFSLILRKNFSKAALLIGVGLSYVFCAVFFVTLEVYFFSHLLFALTLFLLLIVAPVVYWLGQTVPIMTNLFKREASIGAISGKVLFLSTLGSFLGSVLTSILLFNFLGVAWTVVINFFALVFLITLLKPEAIRLFGLIFAGILIYGLNCQVENTLFIHTNNYSNYRLNPHHTTSTGRQGVSFQINNSLSSFLDKQKRGADYIELIKQYLFKDLGLTEKKILVVGAGGFSLSAESDFGNQFEYIDIDPDIKRVTEAYFLKNIHGKFISDDVRKFFNEENQPYDVILSDAYKQQNAIPPYLVTREYFESVARHLKPDGLAVFNFIISPKFNDAYSQRIDNTVSLVFPHCMKVPLSYYARLHNVVYFCKRANKTIDRKFYTDNLNTATLDFFTSSQFAYQQEAK